MGNYIKRIGGILILFLMTFNYKVEAIERSDINFKNITIEDGLSQALVSYIYQDSDGYMWLGTGNGLNRYDGNKFDVYKNIPNDESSISNSSITGIVEDSKRNLWISTSSGLNKMNLDTGEIERYLVSEDDKKYSNSVIDEIIIDSKERIWACTNKGLNLYDEDSDSFQEVASEVLLNKFMQDLAEDGEGNMWIATKEGVYIYSPNDKSIKEFDNGLWINWEKNVTSIAYYDEKIYVGTKMQGLKVIDLKSNEIKVYDENNSELPSNYIRDIYKETNDKMWLATDKGLVLFNEDKESFVTSHSDNTKNSLCNDNVINIYQDNSGMIWVGTFNGVSRFSSDNPFTVYENKPYDENSLSDSSICGIYEDNEGLLWVGTFNSGVNIVDKKNSKVTRIDSGNNNKSLSSNRIRDITGSGDKIYIATDNGLNIYDKETNTIRVLNEDYTESKYNNEIRSLLVDKNETLWVGTNGGLFTLDIKGEVKSYKELFEENDIHERIINSVYEDSQGIIWIGLANEGGVVKYNPKTNTVKRYVSEENKSNSLSSNNVRSITEDYSGNIWIGTQCGLNKLNRATEEFQVYLSDDGLSDDFVYGVIVDNENNIWVSTNYGITMFNQELQRFIRYYEADGLSSNEYNGFSYYKNKEGLLYFGGVNGLTEIDINKLERATQKDSKVKVNTIRTNDGVTINEKDNFILDYNSRSLYMEFFVPEYINENQIHYFYKLDGVDDEWIFAKNEYYARYTNLEPGKYSMNVFARNYNGELTDITKINFTVKNTIFKTPLAYTLYIIIIGIIILVYRSNIKILESLVVKRTIESERKLEENIVLYKKLIEVQKYKNNYFVNLSHELRTPLNVIIAIEQLIRTLIKDGKKIDNDKMQDYMKSLKNNSNRLLNLINNIIDTSKIEAGEYKIEYEEIDIISVVENTALDMVELAKVKDINIIIDPEMEEYIMMLNKMDLERCITNLVGNAIKFTDAGGEIIISISEYWKYIEISIKDNGIGIAKEYQENIFDRFGQVYNKSTEEYGGSGLGLTLTRNLVKLYGGTIRVISEKGRGSEFIITLPKKKI